VSGLHAVPRTWTWVTLQDVAEVVTGNTPPTSNLENYGGEIPFFKPPQLNDMPVGEAPETLSEKGLEKARLLPAKAVLVSCIGILGKTAITKTFSATNQQINAVVFESPIQPEYGFYYVQTLGSWLKEHSSATTVAIINKSKFEVAPFPLPPSAEQTRIVEKLEELLSDLDAGVAELKAAQKKLGQYRQSLLKAAVEGALTADWRAVRKAVRPELVEGRPSIHPSTGSGRTDECETGAQLLQRILQERRVRWETKQLAKFAEQGKTPPKDWQAKYPEPVQPDTSGLPELPEGWVWASVEQIASDERYSLSIGPFGSNLKVPDYRESGVQLVFVRNIRSGNYGGAYTKFVTPEKAEELNAHSIEAGDVLITKMGDPPGDADVYPEGQPPAIITADCIKVRCWAGLMRPDFLKTAINSYIGQRQIEPMTQGVAQKKVSLGRFTSLAVPVPSTQEQDRLMAVVSAANGDAVAQEAAIMFSLKQSAAQRQNILKAAFSGQLVPQDPNDEPASVLLARIRTERAARDAVKKPRGRKPRESV